MVRRPPPQVGEAVAVERLEALGPVADAVLERRQAVGDERAPVPHRPVPSSCRTPS